LAETARKRLKSLIDLYSDHLNPEGMAIELAIRQWARSDAAAARAVKSVDAARLGRLAQLYRKLGLAKDEAQARAVLFYSFIFGQSLVAGPFIHTAHSQARVGDADRDRSIPP
jgi:hypothetical protein